MPVKCCDLSNKVAVVTGASRGIGQAISIKLATSGAKVMLVSRNAADLKSVKELIISRNSKAEFQVCDVSSYDNFADMINKTIENWGTVDILVNNAGITRDNIIMRMKEEDWDSVLTINLKGCFNGIKAVTRPMIKNKSGRIINIASVIGQIGNPGQSNYAASKAGIIGLTKSMAKELGSRNITINSVSPGYIETDMSRKLTDDVKKQIRSSIPLGRFGTTKDVANLVCFLASEEAGYITGQTLNVDGGMVMI